MAARLADATYARINDTGRAALAHWLEGVLIDPTSADVWAAELIGSCDTSDPEGPARGDRRPLLCGWRAGGLSVRQR